MYLILFYYCYQGILANIYNCNDNDLKHNLTSFKTSIQLAYSMTKETTALLTHIEKQFTTSYFNNLKFNAKQSVCL